MLWSIFYYFPCKFCCGVTFKIWRCSLLQKLNVIFVGAKGERKFACACMCHMDICTFGLTVLVIFSRFIHFKQLQSSFVVLIMATARAAEYYVFKRPHVAEYPPPPGTEIDETLQKSVEQKTGIISGNTITLNEIQRDRITKIAAANWSISRDAAPKAAFSPSLVDEIYRTELLVTSGSKSAPLHRVMVLEVSQYLENYLWPNFDPEKSTFEHVMSIILMVNEKVGFQIFTILDNFLNLITINDMPFISNVK